MSEEKATTRNAPYDAPFPSQASARWAVAVLLLLSAMSYLDRQVLYLMVDRVKADLRLDDFKISLLQGVAFALFYGVFGLPFGWAADRFPRRWIIFAGVTIWSVAASACGLAHTFSQLLFARFAVGIGEAALSPAAFSLLSDAFPKHRLTMAIAVFAAGTNIGGALALAVGGLVVGLLPEHGAMVPLVGHLANWQLVFLLTGLPCLAVGWLIFTVIEPLRRDRSSRTPTNIADALRFVRLHWRFYAGHFLGFGLIVTCGAAMVAWTPTYLHRVFGWKMIVIGPVLALALAGSSVVGGICWGAIASRWFRLGRQDAHLRLFIYIAAAQSVLFLAGVAAHNPYVFLVIVAINAFGAPITGVSASALQLVTPNEFRGQVSALFLLVFALGVGLGPAVVAALTTYVFKNDLMVGWSIGVTYLMFMPVVMLSLASAMKPMRLAVAAAAKSIFAILP